VKKKLTIAVTVLGLFALSGLAAASEHDGDETKDTVFNYGYDEENKVLVWGTSPSDGLYDCALENGPIDTTYGPSNDGVIQVPLLESEGVLVMFPPRPESELDDDVVPAEEPANYTGSDGECGVTGVLVPGPNGQVNHGMFMKAINSVFEGQGRGCINRHIARSGLGKDDQQIRVPDVTDSPELMEGDEGTIDFSTVLADCQRGNETELTGQDKAAAKKAAAAEKERGNSTSAPGRSGSSPGKSGSALSNSDSAPGKSGTAPGRDK
jgi:hypothetical protein